MTVKNVLHPSHPFEHRYVGDTSMHKRSVLLILFFVLFICNGGYHHFCESYHLSCSTSLHAGQHLPFLTERPYNQADVNLRLFMADYILSEDANVILQFISAIPSGRAPPSQYPPFS
jgi:hypothetical protein